MLSGLLRSLGRIGGPEGMFLADALLGTSSMAMPRIPGAMNTTPSGAFANGGMVGKYAKGGLTAAERLRNFRISEHKSYMLAPPIINPSKKSSDKFAAGDSSGMIGEGLSYVMNQMYESLLGPSLNSLRGGKPKALSGEDILTFTGSPYLAGQFDGKPVDPSGWDALALAGVLPFGKLGRLGKAVSATATEGSRPTGIMSRIMNPVGKFDKTKVSGSDFAKAWKQKERTLYPTQSFGQTDYFHPDYLSATKKYDLHNSGTTTALDYAKRVVYDYPLRQSETDAATAAVKIGLSGKKWWEEIKNHPKWSMWEYTGVTTGNLNNIVPRGIQEGSEFLAKNSQKSAAIRNSYLGAKDLLDGRKLDSGILRRVLDKGIAKRNSRKMERLNNPGLNGQMQIYTRPLVRMLEKTHPGLQALLLTKLARHRSHKEILDTLHPQDVPVDVGRAYGPGTYFAQTRESSDKSFANFGKNVYKMQTTKEASRSLISGKGYITPQKMAKEFEAFYSQKNNIASHSNVLGNMWRTQSKELSDRSWDDPFIQNLISRGYIGYKHGDALTNWLVGVPNSGIKLSRVNDAEDAVMNLFGKSILKTKSAPTSMVVSQPRLGTARRFPVKTMLEKINKLKNRKQIAESMSLWDEEKLASGGLVGKIKPSYFNTGGLARGTDTIPAMLTPGEFVMSRSAVQDFGVDNLKAINSGQALQSASSNSQTSVGDSVYNSNSYSISVNVSSASDPNDIARTVMAQIQRIDAQTTRSNRY
jgi:hypothetical protein